MKVLLAFVLGVSLAAPAVGDEAGDKEDSKPKPTDQQLIQGTWDVVARVKNGRPEDVKEKPVTLTFAGATVTETKAGEKKALGGFTLDAAQSPRRITLTGKEGDHAGAIFEGIYELTGDRLKIAYGVGDNAKTPPKDFSGGEGSGLLVLERKKDAPQTGADEKLLQGNWKVVAMVRNGKPAGEEQLKDTPVTWRFDGRTATMKRGDRAGEAVYTLDAAKKHISITPREAEEGKGMTGLYELKGDTLKIAFRIGENAKTPPEDFKEGEGLGMMTMERLKE